MKYMILLLVLMVNQCGNNSKNFPNNPNRIDNNRYRLYGPTYLFQPIQPTSYPPHNTFSTHAIALNEMPR